MVYNVTFFNKCDVYVLWTPFFILRNSFPWSQYSLTECMSTEFCVELIIIDNNYCNILLISHFNTKSFHHNSFVEIYYTEENYKKLQTIQI